MTMTMTMRFDKYMLTSLMFSATEEDFNTNLATHIAAVTKLLQDFHQIYKKLMLISLISKPDKDHTDTIALALLKISLGDVEETTSSLEASILRELPLIYGHVSHMFNDGVLPAVSEALVLSIIPRVDNVQVKLETVKTFLKQLATLMTKDPRQMTIHLLDNFKSTYPDVKYILQAYINTISTATIDDEVVQKLQIALRNPKPLQEYVRAPGDSKFNLLLIIKSWLTYDRNLLPYQDTLLTYLGYNNSSELSPELEKEKNYNLLLH